MNAAWVTISTTATNGGGGMNPPPPTLPDGGVREPRRPRPSTGSGSIALPTTAEVTSARH